MRYLNASVEVDCDEITGPIYILFLGMFEGRVLEVEADSAAEKIGIAQGLYLVDKVVSWIIAEDGVPSRLIELVLKLLPETDPEGSTVIRFEAIREHLDAADEVVAEMYADRYN